jgi:hypothetical protein
MPDRNVSPVGEKLNLPVPISFAPRPVQRYYLREDGFKEGHGELSFDRCRL